MKLAHKIYGNRAHDKIMFLHGLGGTGALWRPIAAALEDRFSILALDQRGHGGSQIPHPVGGRSHPKYHPLDYGSDIVETLDELSFYPTWVVGHSMGVRTAAAFAHLKPNWCRGLVLVDLGFSGPAGGGMGDTLKDFLSQLPNSFLSREEARTWMNAHCPDPSIVQYLLAVSVMEPHSKKISFPFDHAALIQTIIAARDSSVRTWIEECAEKKIPILSLRGEKSLVWSKEAFLAEKSHFKNMPSVIFEEFPDTGHGLPFEKRMDFVKRLTRFFEESK